MVPPPAYFPPVSIQSTSSAGPITSRMARERFHRGFTLPDGARSGRVRSQRWLRPPRSGTGAQGQFGYPRETTSVVELLVQHDPPSQKDEDVEGDPNRSNAQKPRNRRRGRRGALLAAGLLATACGGSPSASSNTTTAAGSSGTSAPHTTTPTNDLGTSNTGTGVVTWPGSTSSSQSTGNRSATTFTLAFAECMRAHGVPKFPNPDRNGSQLGPESGVSPASPTFQAAVDGPCRSLAPAGWVSSGPVSKGAGS